MNIANNNMILKSIIKIQQNISTANFTQYLNVFLKYLPLFMITHDISILNGNYINKLLANLTISKYIGTISNKKGADISILIILLIYVIFGFIFYDYYQKIKTNYKHSINEKKKNRFSHFLFYVIFILCSQHLYELLFSVFICEATIKENDKVLSPSCYTTFRFFTMIISLILIIINMIINYIYNLFTIYPLYDTKMIFPFEFGDKFYFMTIIPLLQGYITIEYNLPHIVSFIIRIIIRSLFIFYVLYFYFKSFKHIYSSKKVFYIISFLNSFCFWSIILEFIPMVKDNLNDINFVIIKLLFQILLALVTIYILYQREKNIILATSIDYTYNRKDENFYEFFNKLFYTFYKFNEMNQEMLRSFLNQFFQHKTNCENEKNKNLTKICFCQAFDLDEINNSTKEFFHKLEFYQLFNISKAEILNENLKYFLTFIDDLLYTFVNKSEKIKELNYVKYIFLYSSFLLKFKTNHIKSYFYLDKVIRTKLYKEHLYIRIYTNKMIKMICDDYKKRYVNNNLSKGLFNKQNILVKMQKIFKEVQQNEEIENLLILSTNKLKALLLKFTEKNISYEEFSMLLDNFYKTVEQIYSKKNKIKSELSIETSMKLKVYNDLINRQNNFIDNNNNNINTFLDKLDYKNKDMFMILNLDRNENLIIQKTDKKLLQLLKYFDTELHNQDVSLLIPKMLVEFHKQKVIDFTNSNKNLNKKDIYFITKDNYALLLNFKGVLLPTLNDHIIFFSLFKKVKIENYKTDTCFCVLNKLGEMITVNEEFEFYFGLTNKVIEVIKPNFLSRIIKNYQEILYGENNLFEHEISLTEFIHNIKSLEYDDFKEYSQEAYCKLMESFKKLSYEKYTDMILNVRITKRFIDKIYNKFIFFVIISFVKRSDYEKKLSQCFRGYLSPIKTKGTDPMKVCNSNINNIPDIKSENVHKINEKINRINSEIYKQSINMLRSGSKLWTSQISIDEIVSYNNPSNTNKYFNTKNKSMKSKQNKNAFSSVGFSDDNNYNTYTTTLSNSSLNIGFIKDFHKLSIVFSSKKLILLLIFSLIYLSFYYFVISYLNSRYNEAISIYQISNNLLALKNSLVLSSFTIIKLFLIENEIINFNKNSKNRTTLNRYLASIDESLYNFRMLYSALKSNSKIVYNMDQELIYKLIHQDYSDYYKNLTLIDAAIYNRIHIGLIDSFHNFTFNANPEEYKESTHTYDINKKLLGNRMLTEGDLVVYLLVHNFVQKIIPTFDEIKLLNKDSLSSYSNESKAYLYAFYISLIIILCTIFMFLIFYFYSIKKRIYERYFINFNLMRFFHIYLIQKVDYLEELIKNFNNENYLALKNLTFELNNNQSQNITRKNNNNIRFDLDNNPNLQVITSLSTPKYRRNYHNMNVYNNYNNYNNIFNKDSRGKRTLQLTSIDDTPSAYKNSGKVASNFKDNISLVGEISAFNLSSNNTGYNLLAPQTNTRSIFSQNLNSNNQLITSNTGSVVTTMNVTSNNTTTINKSSANTTTISESTINNTRIPLNYRSNSISKIRAKHIENESDINLKNLLRRPARFYLDISYILIITILIIILNILSVLTTQNNFDNIMFIKNFNEKILQKSFSIRELSLIYMITLMQNKEITSNNNISIFDKKYEEYHALRTNVLEIINNEYNGPMKELIQYESHLMDANACVTVAETYIKYNNQNENKDDFVKMCKTVSNGIFEKGLYLGEETLIYNLINDYKDSVVNKFQNYQTRLNSNTLIMILNAQEVLLDKRGDNVQKIIVLSLENVKATVQLLLSLYCFFVTFLFILLAISFSLIFFVYLRRKYILILNMERIMQNIIKSKIK